MLRFARLVVAGVLAGVALVGAAPMHAEATAVCSPVCASSRSRRGGALKAIGGDSSTSTVPEATTTSTLEPLGGDAPSIIRKPGEEANRPSNDLGLAVGLALFFGWIGAGVLMFRRAARRRAAGVHPPGRG